MVRVWTSQAKGQAKMWKLPMRMLMLMTNRGSPKGQALILEKGVQRHV
jgi:hypothetical protein